jgi:integrase
MRARSHRFESWLADAFTSWVELRRASGYAYGTQAGMLRAFDRYVAQITGAPPLQARHLKEYMATRDHLSPRSRDNVVAVVWPALHHARRHGEAIGHLPARPTKTTRHWRERQPRIVTMSEIGRLMRSARRLPPADGLRPATVATLIGLLYTTGVRIGEALAIDVGDIDQKDRILTIRAGKLGKSRALPIRDATLEALSRYVDHPLRGVGTEPSAPLFVSGRRRRLANPTASEGFRAACRASGIAKPWPRRHDLRHTFAVGRVAAWYAQGKDVDARLPALSTYLGHVSVENTRRYLVANGALLEHASSRFSEHSSVLDEVLS